MASDPRWIRCAQCANIGSDGTMRIWSSTTYRHGQPVDSIQTPPEWTCRTCGRAGPLEIGELLPNDTPVSCRRTFLCRYAWKVPSSLTTMTCPRCYTTQPGPAADNKSA
ncbi:hypothetical protein [Actinomadura rugatobispora]|uniref:Uncharacterized protein n=1 Tax=Actinomadura rugatobispora TaxID=1994 RepID=A0ABW1AGG6_9ACTN